MKVSRKVAGVFAMVLAGVTSADAATLAKYSSFGSNGGNGTSSGHDPSVTPSVFSPTGFTAGRAGGNNNGADFIIFADETGTGRDPSKYSGFTVEIPAGLTVDFTSLTFSQTAGISTNSENGHSLTIDLDVRSSLTGDAFGSTLYNNSVTAVKTTNPGGGGKQVSADPAPSIDLSSYTGVSGVVGFRFYAWDDSDTTTDVHRFDNITLTGNIVPEPTSFGVVVAGALSASLLRRRRRRGARLERMC